jgi:hypothetical protein
MRTLAVLLLATSLVPAQSGWSTPVLVPELNTSASDTGPSLSADGLTVHFASFSSGNWEIWSATRPSRTSPWNPPVLETAVSDPTLTDSEPFMTADGLELWFARLLASPSPSFEIMVSTRPSTTAPWGAPTVVPEVSSSAADSSPSLTADKLEIYILTTGFGAPFPPQNAIFRATRASAAMPFGTPTLVTELSTPNTHRDVNVSPDGLTIWYSEFDPAARRTDIWIASRTKRADPFGTPTKVQEFSTTGTSGVFNASPSADGNELLLAAVFPAASGSQEIMSTRFDGLTHSGVATTTSAMNLHYRDSGSPNAVYALALAFGATGFPLGSRTIPLDADALFFATFATNIAGFSTGFVGTLDAQGEATGTVRNPVAVLTGVKVQAAGFTFAPGFPFGLKTISNAFQLELQ